MNKIDLPGAEPERVSREIEEVGMRNINYVSEHELEIQTCVNAPRFFCFFAASVIYYVFHLKETILYLLGDKFFFSLHFIFLSTIFLSLIK